MLLLALAAIPGSLLIARLGPRRALIAGLLAIGAGSALRGAGPAGAVLFAMTLAMGAGVAVSQPVFPTLARRWFPGRVALATAVYSNGLLFGEMVPASSTGPLVLPALGGSWPLTLAFWSAPVFLGAGLLVLAVPREHVPPAGTPARAWLPDFRDRRTWQIGLAMGFASAAYFGTNTFIPDFVRASGHGGLKDAGLTALNACQLAASVVGLALGPRLVGRWPYLVAGALIAGAAVGLVLTPGPLIVLWASVIGFASALALILTLALPALLAAEADVPRLSAGIFLIVYGSSFAGPVLGGAAWDTTGRPAAAFLTLAAGGAAMVALAAGLRLGDRSAS